MTKSINSKTEVIYRDRQTGALVSEPVFSENQLRWFYEDPLGFTVFNYGFNNSIFCWLYGKVQDLPHTRKKITSLVAQNNINIEELQKPLDSYRSFNDFFSRHLKADARSFSVNPHEFSSPGDGKVLVYPHLEAETRIPVKGVSLSLTSLLASKETAQQYHSGSAAIIRFAPYDYHRFHFPDDGEVSTTRNIKGQYYSVNPIAFAKVPDVFCRNKRAITEFNSKNFGRIAFIEVGAITVGTIVQTYTPGVVFKGQ